MGINEKDYTIKCAQVGHFYGLFYLYLQALYSKVDYSIRMHVSFKQSFSFFIFVTDDLTSQKFTVNHKSLRELHSLESQGMAIILKMESSKVMNSYLIMVPF